MKYSYNNVTRKTPFSLQLSALSVIIVSCGTCSFSLDKSVDNCAMKLLTKTVNPSIQKHSGTLIFFHGSGGAGPNLLEVVKCLLGKDMVYPHIKIIYPTAPSQPYTPLGGESSNVWFDRRAISIEATEDKKSLSQIYETVHELINEEVKQGIPVNRIIVGGFSMGGALAMHTAYHLNINLAGVFCCSSFLNRNSIVYESLQLRNTSTNLPELRMFHGDKDLKTPFEWGKETHDELKRYGVNVTLKKLENTGHELKAEELLEIMEWIVEQLPPLDSDVENKINL